MNNTSSGSDDRKERPVRKKNPRPFRKPLKPRQYQKKLAGRIFLEPDREFLASITETDEDGLVVLARDLSREETARLKKLRKAARKNRRGPRVFRLGVLAVVVAAVIIFNVVFKDALVERRAEALLQNLFAARVDFTGLRFRPVAGEISFDSLTIADVDAPMRNLFEMTSGSVGVDTWQLVNRRILIDELVVEGLQLDTPRESSGAITSRGRADRAGGDGGGAIASDGSRAAEFLSNARENLPPVSFRDLGLPDTLDAEEFLERNLDVLATPGAVDSVFGSAAGFVERWQGELLSMQDELAVVTAKVTSFATTDFTEIRSVDAAMAVYDDATALEATATGMVGRIESLYNALVAEATDVLQSARSLPGLVREDYDSLVARLPDVRGEGREFVVGLVRPYLRSALGVWYGRILKAEEIYSRIAGAWSDREPSEGRRRGTEFDFAAMERPRFLVREARLGVGADGVETLRAAVTSLTSDPEIVDRPTGVSYKQTGRAGLLSIVATLDGRPGVDVPLDLSVGLSDSPLLIARGLEALGIERVDGTLALATSLRKARGGLVQGTLALTASELSVQGSPSENQLGEFIAGVLENSGVLNGEFAFSMAGRDQVEFTSAETNLDDLVAGAVRERIDAALATFRAELQERVTGYLDPLIASLNEKLDGVVQVETSAEELIALARDREAAAAELQRFAQETITSLRDQLEAEARAALDAAKAEAERRAQEALDAAEAEARAAAESAAAEAEDSAREAAGDAVNNLRNRLPLPGRR